MKELLPAKLTAVLLLLIAPFTVTRAQTTPENKDRTATLSIAHRGKPYRLYRFYEFLTGKTELIDKKNPQQDSCIHFNITLESGDWFQIMNDAAKASIFIAPGDSLFVSLPAPDSLSQAGLSGEPEVMPMFHDSISAGSNLHIMRFNNMVEDFYLRYAARLKKPKTMRETLDSLKKAVVNSMPMQLQQGVRDHIRYTLATIEDIVLPNKLFLCARYFGGSIKWRCPAYFYYFRIFFKEYLYSLTLEDKGKNILHAINVSANLEVLDSAFIKTDRYRMNDTLRRLVFLLGLSEVYFKKGFDKVKIDRILEQIKLKSKQVPLSLMAGNVLENCWLMSKGTSLPVIEFERSDGKKIRSDSLRGKKTLLIFFATWSIESQQDLLLLQKLEQKYGHRIRFISILAEGDRQKAITWKKELKLNWELYFDEKQKLSREKWHIRKIPHYLLLDEDGDILKFDSPTPDENLEFLLKNEIKNQKP